MKQLVKFPDGTVSEVNQGARFVMDWKTQTLLEIWRNPDGSLEAFPNEIARKKALEDRLSVTRLRQSSQ